MRFICDRRFAKQASEIMSHAVVPVDVSTISAGKLRRYHGVSLVKQLFDIPTTLQNIGDAFLIGIGIIQSLIVLLRWKPDVVFTKGGFVCLPIGIAARLTRTPLVIHDSDAHPGLTNRILARWATAIATGAPLEHYTYPKAISKYVGIPIDDAFHPFNTQEKQDAKHIVGMVDTAKPLVVITGGGLGARRINDAATTIGQRLIDRGIVVYHITGAGQHESVLEQAPESVDYIVTPFVSRDMAKILGAADAVVTRAGATTLLELAGLASPTIIVPNPMLTGGHQVKNADVYQKQHASIVIDERDREFADNLKNAIFSLIDSPKAAAEMGQRLHAFAKPDAALDVAEMIVSAAAGRHA